MEIASSTGLESHSLNHIAPSCFECIPEICFEHGYTLRRLTESTACFEGANCLFQLHPHTIIAITSFRFEHHTPPAIAGLVENRNSTLRAIGWIAQGRLTLIQPIIRKNLDRNWLDAAITAMVVEIAQFSCKLRANGIWEN